MKQTFVFLPAGIFWILLCTIPYNHLHIFLCGMCAVFLSIGGLLYLLKKAR